MSGNCHNCGLRLFMDDSTIDFNAFEEGTGIVNWWAFNRQDGWKFRDFYMIENAKPVERGFNVSPPDKNYGRQTTPEAISAGSSRTKRFRTREKTKIKPMAVQS
ncbi:MAG: hypothetical protein KGL39_10115 [Patescibacteria group bacterium]|nr:hypothetical protein [Patescibacteria group bacterium]